MAVDRYTKAVLTVIAMCLLWLSAGGPSLITPTNAQSDRVYLAGWIDERDTFRRLPFPPGTVKPAPDKPVPAAPLPIWQTNN